MDNTNEQNTTNVNVASLEEDLQATTKIIAGDVVSSNMETAMGDETSTEKAVLTFVDERPNLIIGKSTQLANSYSQSADNRADIAAYLSRPIHILSQTWNLDNHLDFTFDPWNLFLSNPTVANKIANFQLARFSLGVRFVINGTRFHYGLAMASYNPFAAQVRGAVTIGTPPRDMQLMVESQRPRGFINPMKNDTIEMKLPFFHYNNWLKLVPLVAADVTLGSITFRSMTELKAVSATASTSVEIQVFVYATDVELSMPTAQMKRNSTKQTKGKNIQVNQTNNKTSKTSVDASGNDEHKKDGVISAPATAVANIASNLVNVPVIGPFAKATQLGASAVSQIAQLFGFSKPPIITDTVFMRPTPFTNFATTNGGDSVMKLSFDIKQETTISNDIGGIKNVKDELSIAHIVGTESFMGTITWLDTANFGDNLCTICVSPAIGIVQQAIPLWNMSMTSLGFGSIPFRYWSGTIIYRFQIVASQFHTGRYRLVYEPNGALPVSTDFNNSFSVVMDLQESSDFEIAISWAQPEPYRDVQDIREDAYSTSAAAITYDDRVHNGRLTMSVLNPLKSPESGSGAYINVYARAGPDFEVFCPVDKNATTSLSHQFISYGTTTGPDLAKLPKAQMMKNSDCPDVDAPDDFIKNIQLAGEPDIEVLREKHLIFSGEHISSFRALIKRYNPVEIITQYTGAPAIHSGYKNMRNTFPQTIGEQASFYYEDGGVPTNYAPTSLIAYLRGGFVGYRGGLRYKYINIYQNQTHSISAVRKSDNEGLTNPAIWSNLVVGAATDRTGVNQEYFALGAPTGGWQGACATTSSINNTLEVEYPYYNKYRFMIATNQDLPLGLAKDGSSTQLSSVMVWNGGNSANEFGILSMVAAAEDFNLLWYIGAPFALVEGTL